MRSTCTVALVVVALAPAAVAEWTLVGWNDVGLRCIDPDYTVFALLPPGNTGGPYGMNRDKAVHDLLTPPVER
jgi:hypothetical protein